MKADIKAEWIKRLRSGQYVQGREVLRNEKDEFCCLGVLCDIVAHDKWFMHCGGEWAQPDGDGHRTACLPVAVQAAVGFDYDTVAVLVYLNDAESKSFTEIADYIEENL
jgi:hypothetical protein